MPYVLLKCSEDLARIPTLAEWLRAIKGEKCVRSAAPAERVTDELV